MQKILQGLSEELSEYSNITDAAVLKKAIDKQTFTSLSDCLSLAQ
jgi:hypothetical protein